MCRPEFSDQEALFLCLQDVSHVTDGVQALIDETGLVHVVAFSLILGEAKDEVPAGSALVGTGCSCWAVGHRPIDETLQLHLNRFVNQCLVRHSAHVDLHVEIDVLVLLPLLLLPLPGGCVIHHRFCCNHYHWPCCNHTSSVATTNPDPQLSQKAQRPAIMTLHTRQMLALNRWVDRPASLCTRQTLLFLRSLPRFSPSKNSNSICSNSSPIWAWSLVPW